MATSIGARAMHIEHLVGSLEPGKRADLIVIEMGDVRHQPYFRRDRESIYSRIVYATHASDVRDVMVNGRWLMRDRKLLTLDLEPLLAEVDELARSVDTFLIHREGSVLSKLLAIGSVAQEQTFEVQVKVAVDDLAAVEAQMLADEAIIVTRNSMRPQFDTYFLFDDEEGSILRYREDEVHDLESGELITVIYRLTLTTAKKEREYENSILLPRSRFDAPADRSLRFYREYFRPKRIVEVQKERRRYHIRFGGTDFAVNFDRITKPPLGSFVEIKSRTWSRQDAEHKAALIGKLLTRLGLDVSRVIKEEYVQLAEEALKE
jgi:5-methylthioadenosine/S-adenosylhomocysteine deaminase